MSAVSVAPLPSASPGYSRTGYRLSREYGSKIRLRAGGICDNYDGAGRKWTIPLARTSHERRISARRPPTPLSVDRVVEHARRSRRSGPGSDRPQPFHLSVFPISRIDWLTFDPAIAPFVSSAFIDHIRIGCRLNTPGPDFRKAVLRCLIGAAGFTPAQRDNVYDILRVHDTTASPDLKVTDWSEHRTKRLHIESKAEVEAKVALSVTAGK